MCAVKLRIKPDMGTRAQQICSVMFLYFVLFCFQGAERKIRDEERKLFRKKSKGWNRRKKLKTKFAAAHPGVHDIMCTCQVVSRVFTIASVAFTGVKGKTEVWV